MSSSLNTGVNKSQELLEGSHPTPVTERRPSIEIVCDLNTDFPDTLPTSEQEDHFGKKLDSLWKTQTHGIYLKMTNC